MTINKDNKINREALYKEIDATNDTCYSTDVLVQIVETHEADEWEELTDEAWEAMKKRIIEKNI